MKVIGMIGGMSWESTSEYYRLANVLVRQRLGGLSSSRIVLHSVDFAEVERLQVAGDWAAAGRLLADAAVGLERAGADLLVLCTNTMHVVAPAIVGATTLPLLHIGDVVADAAAAAGLTRVGLLGTRYTMEQPFLLDHLAGRGLQVLVPGEADRALVHQVIFDELCLGVVTNASRARFREVIERLVAAGAQGVVLGCTEIELLVGAEDSPVPVFPTTRLHVEAAVDAQLALP